MNKPEHNFPIDKIRNDFSILKQKIYNKPLVYFDNGATTQKPDIVIDSVADFYKTFNSNIHRGVHFLSDKSTDLYEQARKKVQNFINAKHAHEIIFTKGTTDSINLVASSFGQSFNNGDEIIISQMEHHSNIVPWQLLRESKGIIIKIIPMTDDFQLDFKEYQKLFTEKTKFVSLLHISNSLGTINPIEKYINFAHIKNVPVLIDAAQSIQHKSIDVQKLDADFIAFSGHKMYAETGIGVLYGKEKLLNKMPPYQAGGDMIKEVTFEKTTFAELPFKFEAGTSNYAGALSIKYALDYIENIGLEKIACYEGKLTDYAIEKLHQIEDITIYSTSELNKTGIVSFNIKNIHHLDIGTMLDKMGIAIRTGGHCTYPLMQRLNVTGTVRASFSFYNTFDEIDFFYDSLLRVIKLLKQ
ncbi:MAG: cysteine desulfurase [Bacteroidota bacterium]|nr:cysteine desulfurase [Bacteroidota bacterium]